MIKISNISLCCNILQCRRCPLALAYFNLTRKTKILDRSRCSTMVNEIVIKVTFLNQRHVSSVTSAAFVCFFIPGQSYVGFVHDEIRRNFPLKFIDIFSSDVCSADLSSFHFRLLSVQTNRSAHCILRVQHTVIASKTSMASAHES